MYTYIDEKKMISKVSFSYHSLKGIKIMPRFTLFRGCEVEERERERERPTDKRKGLKRKTDRNRERERERKME